MGDVEEFSTRVTHADGTTIVEVRGEVDIITAPALSKVLDSALDEPGRVLVDLRSIGFIDSSGLAALLQAHQAAPQRVVIRPNQKARRVLEAAGLLGVIALDDGEEEQPGHDLLRLLVASVVDYAILALDPEGRIATRNAGAERLKGYHAEEILGRHFSVLYPEADRLAGKPDQELAITAADGRLEDEGWRVRKDGSMFWANVVITALRSPDGRLIGFGKVTRDLTERRRGEEQLRESEERFRLLVNNVSDYAIFHLDPVGVITSWNIGAERLKGYRADEILGHHFSQFYTREDVTGGVPAAALESALADGRWESQGWRLRKDGSRFWADVVITALHDSHGVHRGFAKVTRDLTSRKRNEDALRGVLERERETAAKLRELDRLRNEVVSVVAHDLRAPLGVVQSLTHLLRVEWAALDEGHKADYLDRIEARLTTMGELVGDVFDLARIESGQLEVARVEFEVTPIVHRAIDDVVADPTSRLIEVRAAPGVRALADPTRTVQVISNLLSNALKFSPPDAPITILVEQDNAGVHISVSDLGGGIADDDHERLFQPFTRLDRHHGTRGTGLGLYIARALTQEQGGALSLHSVPGHGSTFTITLPAPLRE